jgi:hypothetical protein
MLALTSVSIVPVLLRRTAMDDSQIELLTKEERLLETEITQLQDTGMTAQTASKQADLDEIRADLKKQYREIW